MVVSSLMRLYRYVSFIVGRIIWDFIVNIVASSKLVPNILRFVMYKLVGISTSSRNINPDCFFTYFRGRKVKIGKDSFINYRCFFDSTSTINIGDNCFVGFDVMFCTSSHELGGTKRRAGNGTGVPIRIEDGCWIGARATILSGVTIGKGCIIAAGSIVNKDCEPNGLYAGVPAKRVKDLP